MNSEASPVGASGGASAVAKLQHQCEQKLQVFLDKATPHTVWRWVGWVVVFLLYVLRVTMLQGFYIISYGLGIFNLNLLLGFMSPQVDPDTAAEGPDLPTKEGQEFKPFVRKLPEFKFW